MNKLIILFNFIFFAAAVAGEPSEVLKMTHAELISYCQSYNQTSQGEIAIVLERSRQEHTPILAQILLENSLRRIDALQILATWPLVERKNVFKLALSNDALWKKIEESDVAITKDAFLNEMVFFAHNLGITTDAASFLNVEQRKHLLQKMTP